MPIILPGTNKPDVEYTTTLEGQGYDIRLRWNNRSKSWFLYIGITGSTPILKTRLTTNTNLLANYKGNPLLPQGSLYVLDTEKVFGRPSIDNLGIGRRFQLVYYRSTEDDLFTSLSL